MRSSCTSEKVRWVTERVENLKRIEKLEIIIMGNRRESEPVMYHGRLIYFSRWVR